MAGSGSEFAKLMAVLADPLCARVVGVLRSRPLSTDELQTVLGRPRRSIPNALRGLKRSGLIQQLNSPMQEDLHELALSSWDLQTRRVFYDVLMRSLATIPEHPEDLKRLEEVSVTTGHPDLFDSLASELASRPGRITDGVRHAALVDLLPRTYTIADIGCGLGGMASLLLGRCGTVICVDRSESMLEQVREKFGDKRHGTAIEFRKGTLEDLPLQDGELDACVLSMVLHHASSLRRSIGEIRRVLKMGGVVSVLELEPNEEHWMRTQLGYTRLGISSSEILGALTAADLKVSNVSPIADSHYEIKRPDGSLAKLKMYRVCGQKMG